VSVFQRTIGSKYPLIERGEGVRLFTSDGREILDACGGGAMVASLGHGVDEIVDAAAEQSKRITYLYFHHFTNEVQERYAERLIAEVAPEMARVRFVSGGSEANEMALRMVRSYHVERGEEARWRIISPAQAYHGATIGALALTGRDALREPYSDYLAPHLHLKPSSRRFDPSGEAALEELDGLIDEAGPETVAAFLCEPVSAAALPGYSPPARFWEGLAERRERHGFLVVFDEIVTGMGRTGSWFAYQQLPIKPDVVSAGKGMGAGYMPLAATLCKQHVFDAFASGSREFEHGHTWDGAPLSCAVGLAVLDKLEREQLVERVRERGPPLRDELEAALGGFDLVREVRGRGYLLGVEYVDPRDGESMLPDDLNAAELLDSAALELGLLVTSTHSNRDGIVGDQTLLTPAYTSTDQELAEIVERLAAAVERVEEQVKDALTGAPA
jgi:adenosylmethionine-8-amino-7-oxononanoate aminotransferase